MKLLLVDDDAFLRDMYATKFTQSGDTVATAASGQEALALITNEQFDAVVVDMVMPGLTGPDLIAAITEKKAQCIVLSNQSEPKDIEAATKAGASGYLIKASLIPSEVVTQVHALVDKT